MKKTFISLMLSIASAIVVPNSIAQPNNWAPDRAVKIIVPFNAGGNADLVARAIADQMSREIGQPVIIENRGGAGGTIGAGAVARATPDGLTLALTTVTSHSASPIFYKDIPYNPVDDFEHVITLVATPKVMVARADFPADSIPGAIEEFKTNPLTYFYGATAGGVDHLYAESFKKRNKVDITFVPYKGSAAAMPDLLGGRIQILFDNLPMVLPHLQTNTLKLLAISWHTRLEKFPDVPTWKELGHSDINYSTWYGIALPKNTDPRIVDYWNSVLNKVIRDKAVESQLANSMAYVIGGSPEEATQTVAGTWQNLQNVANNMNIERR